MFIPIFDVNPNRDRPIVNYALLTVCVLAWLWQLGLSQFFGPNAVVHAFGMIPARVISDPVGDGFTVLTSMFMHGGWAHLGGNLLFLYVFGDNVEESLGHYRYLAFYLISGIAAAVAQVLVDPSNSMPMVGASGAIAGVLGAYLVLFPNAAVGMFNTVFLLWPILGIVFYVPAWMAIGTWFIWNVSAGLGHLSLGYGDGVAYFAHIGGFITGLLAIRVWMSGRQARVGDRWSGWQEAPRSIRGVGSERARLIRRWSPPGRSRHLP